MHSAEKRSASKDIRSTQKKNSYTGRFNDTTMRSYEVHYVENVSTSS